MAGAMAKIAMSQEAPMHEEAPRKMTEFDINLPNESVEIKLLPDALAQEQVEIIEERQMMGNPIKAYAKLAAKSIAGSTDEDEETEEEKRKQARRRKKDDGSSAMVKFLKAKMPILTWLPRMDRRSLMGDIVAGVTVGVMVIPQSMSYGAIAGLPYSNGMYSACVPTLVYALFGQSRQLAVGPVAMVSLLVEAGLAGALSEEECPEWYAMGAENSPKAQYELCPEQYVQLAVLTALVVGVFQVVGAFLKLGFLVTFLGHPVISGFTSAAAIIIGLSQSKYLLGYDLPKSQFIYVTVWNIIKDLDKMKVWPFFLGCIFFACLYGNKLMARKYSRLRMMGPMGPLLSCAFGTLLVWAVPVLREDLYVKYVGHIPEGLMPVSVDAWIPGNIGKVLPTALSSTLIGYMESIAIGKNLASKHGYEIEAGQEMLALGLSNVVGAAFSCYPVTGSFSRSAVNNTTGCRSQFSGIVTSVVMFCTLLFLTPFFYYLPKFVLAVIVMNSVFPLVDFAEAKHLAQVKKHDFILWVTAFIGTLFLGVLMGIIVAVGLSLIIVISESVRPQITILWRIPGTQIYRGMKQEKHGSFVPNVFICRIGSSMYFANASFVKEMLLTYVADLEEVNKIEYLVLEMTPVITIDSTACHVIHDIVSDFRSRGIEVAFAQLGNRVLKTMKKAKLKQTIKDKWMFQNVNDAVQFCLKHQHAKKMMAERPGIAPQSSGALDLTAIDIGCSNEIGITNDMDPDHTMLFITLLEDWPTTVSDITGAIKKNRISVSRYTIEPLAEGSKHTYFLKSDKSSGKLSAKERERMKDDLDVVLKDNGMGATQSSKHLVAEKIGKNELLLDNDAPSLSQDRITMLEEQVLALQSKPSSSNSRKSNIVTCCDSVGKKGFKANLCGLGGGV